jgi:hypothetical protein
MEQGIRKTWNVHIMECYSTIKMIEIMSFGKKEMDMDVIMLKLNIECFLAYNTYRFIIIKKEQKT